MPRKTPEWIAKHDDQKVPDRVRLRVLIAYDRKCYLSGRPIAIGAAWELEHKVALILGGEHRENNLAPALGEPHKRKTAVEVAIKSKIADVAKKAYGITAPAQKIRSAPFPKRDRQRVVTKAPVARARSLYQPATLLKD